ncbi:hypothetical protein M0R19_05370 [Candidatus Pacearchaeota archaeon]|jgi:hypothetical protein|nr:hypothetical protein [Candidatus Pacearchaeota archaeon]
MYGMEDDLQWERAKAKLSISALNLIKNEVLKNQINKSADKILRIIRKCEKEIEKLD